MTSIAKACAAVVLALVSDMAGAAAPPPAGFDAQLLTIQQNWAQANYASPTATAKKAALETLAGQAADFSRHYPDRAEPLIWEGIVLSTYAGAKGGLGALSLAKQARERLQLALKIDATALEGSAYTSLGTLYYKVPGFPLGFGNREQAENYLRKAIELNPSGIDPNFFYAELLFEEGRYSEAAQHLRTALAAPPRPHRELADAGRRKEVTALLDKALAKAS